VVEILNYSSDMTDEQSVNYTIRGISASLHLALKAQAKRNNRSLQAEMLEILEEGVQQVDYYKALSSIHAATEALLPHLREHVTKMVLPWNTACDLCKATHDEWPEMSDRLLREGPNALNGITIDGFEVAVDVRAQSILFT